MAQAVVNWDVGDDGALESTIVRLFSTLGTPAATQKRIWAFLACMDKHDPGTYRHQLRTAVYSYYLSSPENQSICTTGACLHDTGKLWCSQELLRRDISLQEYEEIKLHPRCGYLALRPYLPAEAMINGLHHNRNGYGYGVPIEEMMPNASDEERSFHLKAAMVVGVADSFDALQRRRDRFNIDKSNPLQVSAAIAKDQFIDLAESLRMTRVLISVGHEYSLLHEHE